MFKPASRRQARLRLGLIGPAGSGKTYTALRVAMALLPRRPDNAREDDPHYRLGTIDTEHGSANLYAGEDNPDGGMFDFDAVELHKWAGKFSVENYLTAIQGAADAGYPVLLVDSLSHAWAGPGGILEFVDDVTERSKSRNAYSSGWRQATPKHNQLVDALLSYPGHIICTLRSKVEYVMEDDGRGKKAPRKIGLQPVQREGLDYEFTVVGDIEQDSHRMLITKSRCSLVADRAFVKAGADLANELSEWLATGVNWHDERWEHEKRRFFAALGEIGSSYDDACALQDRAGGLRPSQIGTTGRKALLQRLRDARAEDGEE